MKIAQISPLYESVPPKLYGGTERVVSYLTEELVRQGHDVTLFASADSVSLANLVSCAPTVDLSTSQRGDNPDLKAWGAKTLPHLKGHLSSQAVKAECREETYYAARHAL